MNAARLSYPRSGLYLSQSISQEQYQSQHIEAPCASDMLQDMTVSYDRKFTAVFSAPRLARDFDSGI